jgi:hypothetical protein
MISLRPKVILWAMVVLTIALGIALFIFPARDSREHAENPPPHPPEQTPN